MSVPPDLFDHGYQVVQELGGNRKGGRTTWQAIETKSQKTVIIKQFCFAQANSSWSGYKACLNEIELLKSLAHPQIPGYLDSMEIDNGFCLIQKYLPGQQLNTKQEFNLEQIKQLGCQILDILIYLQQLSAPVLHLDIRPDNILVDQSLSPSLIDFGLARCHLAPLDPVESRSFRGNSGFIAPEQIVQPTMATDLYGLGLILVCLLTQQNIEGVRPYFLIDDPFQLDLVKLLPDLDQELRQWLNSMTSSQVIQRFPDALTAKEALLKIDWLLVDVSPAPQSVAQIPALSVVAQPSIVVGALGIFGLSATVVWSLYFAAQHVELSFVNLAIACLAGVAIATAQWGGVAIAKLEPPSRRMGGLLNIGIPFLLVMASGLIWGKSEAVLIAGAITITETLLLTYCWWCLPRWHDHSWLRLASGLGAILLGLLLGASII